MQQGSILVPYQLTKLWFKYQFGQYVSTQQIEEDLDFYFPTWSRAIWQNAGPMHKISCTWMSHPPWYGMRGVTLLPYFLILHLLLIILCLQLVLHQQIYDETSMKLDWKADPPWFSYDCHKCTFVDSSTAAYMGPPIMFIVWVWSSTSLNLQT